jgi:hypothetical protein
MTAAIPNDTVLVPAGPEPHMITAGETVVIHARFRYGVGAEECVGIFRATRNFDPVAEHAAYAAAYPKAGPPQTWTPADRNAFVLWAVHVAGFLEHEKPFYLFLEPWPEKPEAADDTTEKVAHADR